MPLGLLFIMECSIILVLSCAELIFTVPIGYTNSDKKYYEELCNIQHSRCYTEYNLKRTGCVGCPFNPRINEELAIIEKNEPQLYKAAMNIFGKSYEYTAKYRAFVKEMKAKEKEQKHGS